MPALWLLLFWTATAREYDLRGQITPHRAAQIALHGATFPFSASSEAGEDGRFQFRKLAAGAYNIYISVPGYGELYRTVEVGPGSADGKGKVSLDLNVPEGSRIDDATRSRVLISAKQLAVSNGARQEYAAAQKCLSGRDTEGAVRHLQRAVELSPQFSAAWNNLGTIAYQTRRFAAAQEYFERALTEDPNAFDALVNLGGVTLTLGKLDDALTYNLHAMLSRPEDALANSQLGMTYLAVNNLELAQKYLEIAKRIDPGHFSHPQLSLAEIHMRRKENGAAATELEDFLQRHPDYAQADRVRAAIVRLRE